MSEARVRKEGGENCRAVGPGGWVAQGKSESTIHTFAGTFASVGLDTPAARGIWHGVEPGESSFSHIPYPLASTPSPLPDTFSPFIDNDLTESTDTGFYTPPASGCAAFARQLDEPHRRTEPKDLTARLHSAPSWHSVSEVDLDQIIVDGIHEARWRFNPYQPEDAPFAPTSPKASEASTQGRGLASPFCWPDSKTAWRLEHPDRQEYRRIKQDFQMLEWDDEMCACRRTRAASWALNSVVAWGSQGPVRWGGQMEGHQYEDGPSLWSRVISWLRSLWNKIFSGVN